jgi:hypothetical protein
METEKTSERATLHCKLCKSAIALYGLELRDTVQKKASINPIIQSRTRCYSSRNLGHMIISINLRSSETTTSVVGINTTSHHIVQDIS